jgi:four helix bundle protein
MGLKSVEDLDVWRESLALVKTIYEATRTWPREEVFGLTAQARTAAVSIPANLAEGRGRGTPREMCRYVRSR